MSVGPRRFCLSPGRVGRTHCCVPALVGQRACQALFYQIKAATLGHVPTYTNDGCVNTFCNIRRSRKKYPHARTTAARSPSEELALAGSSAQPNAAATRLRKGVFWRDMGTCLP